MRRYQHARDRELGVPLTTQNFHATLSHAQILLSHIRSDNGREGTKSFKLPNEPNAAARPSLTIPLIQGAAAKPERHHSGKEGFIFFMPDLQEGIVHVMLGPEKGQPAVWRLTKYMQ